MHFYDAADNELGSVDLSSYKDTEIHELLQSNGLQKTEL